METLMPLLSSPVARLSHSGSSALTPSDPSPEEYFIFHYFMVAPHSMCNLSPPARDQTCAPCSGSMGHQGRPKLNVLARGCVDDMEGSCLRGGVMKLTGAPLLFLKKLLSVYWLLWAFVTVLSLCSERGDPLVVVCGLLTAVASRFGARAPGTWTSVVVARGLSCPAARGIF